jgi:hypothetical protein
LAVFRRLGEREKEMMGLRFEMQKRVNLARRPTETQVRELQVHLGKSRRDRNRKQMEWEVGRKQLEYAVGSELAAVSVKAKALIAGNQKYHSNGSAVVSPTEEVKPQCEGIRTSLIHLVFDEQRDNRLAHLRRWRNA